MAIKYADGRIEHAGEVYAVLTNTERIMSDVWADLTYAFVWTGGETKKVFLYGDGADVARADVDATPEVQAAIAAFRAEVDRKVELERMARDARTITKGKRVRVVRGRKVALGIEGTAFWIGQTKYGERIGFNDDAGETFWTAASNVEVVPVCPVCAE